MAYMRKTVIAGQVIEVTKYVDPLYGKRKRGRGRRKGKSSCSVEAANERNAINRLRWKLNAAFSDGDYHVTLTYKEKASPEEAKRLFRNFLARLRRMYEKQGFELRWLAVTEWQGHRIHHHVVVNAGPTIQEICKVWTAGRPKVSIMDTEGQYSDLAAYLIKETGRSFRDADNPYKKRWSCSRNLPEPVVITEVVSSGRWREEPKPKKGYMIEKGKTINDVTESGMPYQFYSMRRIC